MLIYDPDCRISARNALKHPFFKVLRDAEIASRDAYVLTSMSPKFKHRPEATNISRNLYFVN